MLAVVLAGVCGCVGGGGRVARPAPATGAVEWRTIGRSAEGRPIEVATVGAGGARVLLIGGIHGNEAEGAACLDELIAALASAPAMVRVVRDMNPDGTAAGTRLSARGVDLNRNWPARNFSAGGERGTRPLGEPETAAVGVEMRLFAPELVVVLHSTAGGPFVNYDGPARGMAAAFASVAGWRVVEDMGYPTPGSLGSWVGVDGGVPILTIELGRGRAAPCGALAAGMRAAIGAMTPVGGS